MPSPERNSVSLMEWNWVEKSGTLIMPSGFYRVVTEIWFISQIIFTMCLIRELEIMPGIIYLVEKMVSGSTFKSMAEPSTRRNSRNSRPDSINSKVGMSVPVGQEEKP